MTFILKSIVFVAICALAFFVTHRVAPWVFVHLGRLFGLRMRLTPLTAKRVRRFQSIKRGYWK